MDLNEAVKELEELARRLINCNPGRENECGEVRCDKENGVVPRYFGFYGDFKKAGEIDAIVIGENPGRMSTPERLWWQVKDVVNDPYGSYCGLIKEAVGEKDEYFYLPYAYVSSMAETEAPVVYYSNTSKCEYSGDKRGKIIRKRCFEKYLRRELLMLKEALERENRKPVIYLLGHNAGVFKKEIVGLLGGYSVFVIPHPSRKYTSKNEGDYFGECNSWIER